MGREINAPKNDLKIKDATPARRRPSIHFISNISPCIRKSSSFISWRTPVSSFSRSPLIVDSYFLRSVLSQVLRRLVTPAQLERSFGLCFWYASFFKGFNKFKGIECNSYQCGKVLLY